MADALSKELGLNNPPRQYASHADRQVREQSYPSTQNPEIDTSGDTKNADREKWYERNRHSTESYGLHRTQSGVDVERAEKDFAELSKELSSISRRISRTQSNASRPRAR